MRFWAKTTFASRLDQIVAGVVQPDAGSIALDGVPRRFGSPSAATAAGVVEQSGERGGVQAVTMCHHVPP